jgi:hypothetical protein
MTTPTHRDRDIPSWPHDGIIHAYWVTDRLLAGAYPSSDQGEAAAAEKRRALLDANVTSFVDLTEKGERGRGGKRLERYDHLMVDDGKLRGLTVRHERKPIEDNSVVSLDEYDEILRYIRAEIDARRTVYVHCWGGKGRTGTVVGAWLIENDGLDYEGALDRMHRLRRGTQHADHRVPDTEEQHDVLRRLAQRRTRRAVNE